MTLEHVSDATYHANPALGSSTVKRFASMPPAKAILPMTPNRQMVLGTCFHSCMAGIAGPYLVAGDLRTKEGKAIRDQAIKEDIPCLNVAEHEQVREMVSSCRLNPLVTELLLAPDRLIEHAGFAKYKGVDVKVKPDLVVPAMKLMVDWKTTRDASPEGFAKAVANLGYHIQEHHYRLVWDKANGPPVTRFLFVCVETREPYLTAIYELDRATRYEGEVAWNAAFTLYKSCLRLKHWPGYEQEPQRLQIPRWAFKHTDPTLPDRMSA